MDSNIDFIQDPALSALSPEQEAQFQALVTEVDAVIRKHGFSNYLLSVSFDGPPQKSASAISTMETKVVAQLLAHAFTAARNMTKLTNPSTPGGVA